MMYKWLQKKVYLPVLAIKQRQKVQFIYIYCDYWYIHLFLPSLSLKTFLFFYLLYCRFLEALWLHLFCPCCHVNFYFCLIFLKSLTQYQISLRGDSSSPFPLNLQARKHQLYHSPLVLLSTGYSVVFQAPTHILSVSSSVECLFKSCYNCPHYNYHVFLFVTQSSS